MSHLSAIPPRLVLLAALLACAARAERAVIAMRATGTCALAERSSTLTVSATSPAGHDLSPLTYCLCGPSNAVITSYRAHPARTDVKLIVNLPAGLYHLRATDGTWFYGDVPVTVLRRENPFLAPDAALVVRAPRPAGQEAGHLWRDLWAGRRRDVLGEKIEARRFACRADEAACAPAPEIPLERIERALAAMQVAGLNQLVFTNAPAHFEAWRAKAADADIALVVAPPRAPSAPRAWTDALASDDAVALDSGLALSDVPAHTEALRAFARAYRALPAVPFAEIGRRGAVRVRRAAWGARTWFYLVNTGTAPASVTLDVPERTEDVLAEKRLDGFFAGSTLTFTLAAGELRVCRALEGDPVLR